MSALEDKVNATLTQYAQYTDDYTKDSFAIRVEFDNDISTEVMGNEGAFTVNSKEPLHIGSALTKDKVNTVLATKRPDNPSFAFDPTTVDIDPAMTLENSLQMNYLNLSLPKFRGSKEIYPPMVPAGLRVWLDPDYLSLPDNTVLSSFPDKSINHYDAVVEASIVGPLLMSSLIPGHNLIKYQQSRHCGLVIPKLCQDITTEMTLFMVTRTNIIANSSLILAMPSDTSILNIHLPWDNNNVTYFDFGNISGNGRLSGTFSPYSSLVLWTFIVRPSYMGIYKNSVLMGSKAASDSFANASKIFTVGGRAETANTWDGDMGDLLVYNKALSDTDRGMVEKYLASKWQLY